MAKYETHDFYCIVCGQKAIPIMRKAGHQHGRLHMKKLYCPYCKKEVNHVECRSREDVEEFLDNFEKGVYVELAEESLAVCGNSRVW